MSSKNLFREIIDVEKILIAKVLTVAQSSLRESQFKGFKKLIYEFFHGEHKEKLNLILSGSDHVMAVPQIDNIGEKGGCPNE